MARVAITEFAAKKLVFGDEYQGISVTPANVASAAANLPAGEYIVKVDVGIKKRGKQGLIRLNVAAEATASAAEELFSLGHERCVVEPMVPHEESAEKYLSIDLVREGALLIVSEKGGVDIEEASDADVQRIKLTRAEVLEGAPANADTLELIAGAPLPHLLQKMSEYNFSFLEINPYLSQDDKFIALDMAVEIDSTKAGKLPQWVQEHILHKKAASSEEAEVLEQDARTQAALNLHTLNQDGSILTLLSGGGASLVALDSLVTAGLSDQVINYSEYSGAPTKDETAAYVATLLSVLFNSKAKNKAILIAGGVANFTDVLETFQGIVDAFAAQVAELKRQNIFVLVRRGGPNQEKGLAHLQDFLEQNQIPHEVHDPSLSLGEVGHLLKSHV